MQLMNRITRVSVFGRGHTTTKTLEFVGSTEAIRIYNDICAALMVQSITTPNFPTTTVSLHAYRTDGHTEVVESDLQEIQVETFQR